MDWRPLLLRISEVPQSAILLVLYALVALGQTLQLTASAGSEPGRRWASVGSRVIERLKEQSGTDGRLLDLRLWEYVGDGPVGRGAVAHKRCMRDESFIAEMSAHPVLRKAVGLEALKPGEPFKFKPLWCTEQVM